MADRLYTIDEYLLKLNLCQKYTGLVYFDFRRQNDSQPFRFKSLLILYTALTCLCTDGVCNIMKIISEIKEDRLSEAKQIGAVFSIEFLCIVRGIPLMFKYNSILALTNDLDKIFPKTKDMQERMNVRAFAKYLELRHLILCIYGTLGLIAFIGLPLFKYIVFYDKKSGEPLLDEYHQHASWFPFHLKEKPQAYPYLYVYESILTIMGLNCLFTWDHIYTISVAQLVMHFEYINDQIKQLDANDTRTQNTSGDFNKRLVDIIKYHQHILILGDRLREAFNFSLYITDGVSAGSICFHLYLMANSDDVISIVLFIFPCFVQVMFAFDNCYQGQRVAEASERMMLALTEQNWYDGSLQYQKFLNLLMLFSNKHFMLSGYSLFCIDMLHFRGTMMMAYRLFTFLQARGQNP